MATTSKSGTPDTHLELAGKSILDADNTARDHHLYKNVTPDADGLYHCPWENHPQSNCRHRPEKLKCNYDKFVDSHLQPYRCKLASCQDLKFSSTACLLRHEREAHGLHGHGDKPFLCTYEGCERGIPGNGFPRHWNLRDHMKRVHDNPGSRYNSRTPSPHREGLGKAPKSTSEPSKVSRRGDDTKASEMPKVTEQWPWVSGPDQPDLVNRYHEKHQTFEALVGKLADPTQADNMALLRNMMDCIKVMAQTTQRINATGGLLGRNDSQPSDENGKGKAT
ncbi:hypothetical protein DL98DRAFT_636213 [Cadophora sp. DSE1049]|nr:hypothetical protein DL98DRAFT_636213 [Cadophora sp. DSE1049]